MKNKKIAIIQSNYIPWKGYFDIINMVDEFIIYDCVQFTKRDWRNRNLIKTPHGLKWLTIPVKVKGRFHQKIEETQIADKNWNIKHWQKIEFNYSKAPFFKKFKPFFKELYLNLAEKELMLSNINFLFLTKICNLLNIKTRITKASNYNIISKDKNLKLSELCKKTKANIYLTGPAARTYINLELFKKSNIQVKWMDYSNYKLYPQLYPPFKHEVTILDLIFNTGENFYLYMKSMS